MQTKRFEFDVSKISQMANGTFISVEAEIDTADLPSIADNIEASDICNSDKNKYRMIEEIGIEYIINNLNIAEVVDCLVDLLGVDEIMILLNN